MGQGYSLTTLSAGSAGIDVPELSDLTYEKSLGNARFMKCIRARSKDGLIIAKVVMKPYASLQLSKYIKALLAEREVLFSIPNTLGYYRILETSTNGYLVRQYIHSSLYDRISTRPFLEDIEKKWLAFQLLCAVRDCHARNIFHGDIKTENILVTSWNWLYLCDFSSSFKPTYLPEDNPADFSFFFDTSGRRTCYLAPERFLRPGDDTSGKSPINWAMDIFSVGCVIAELFLENPIFSLSQLFKYRSDREYDPVQLQLSRIADKDVRDMVSRMITLDPQSRYSADEHLSFWRGKVFPDYFYEFLHQYMHLITDPSSGRSLLTAGKENLGEADDRIDRVYQDFEKIGYFLAYRHDKSKNGPEFYFQSASTQLFPLQVDLPHDKHLALRRSSEAEDDGTLIFLTLVVASLRSTARASARLRACELLLAFAERVTDEAKLDRIVPYLVSLLSDRTDAVKVAALRTITQVLALVKTVSPTNANILPDYLLPRFEPFIAGALSDPSPWVRATYASCLASLATTAAAFLEMIQVLRDNRALPIGGTDIDGGLFTQSVYQTLYDSARESLVSQFENQVKHILTDTDVSVRRAFLGSVATLCVFFGSAKASDVLLSHLNTYLNHRDWQLRCDFFETIVGVGIYVGSASFEEFILPLMIQTLTDPEEAVAERVIRSLSAAADLGLFQRSRAWELVDLIGRFLVHPNTWIREAAAQFIASISTFLSTADTHSIVAPTIGPYLRVLPTDYTETSLLDSLAPPLPRLVYELALNWSIAGEKGVFWKPVRQRQTLSFNSAVNASPRTPRNNTASNALARIPRNDDDEGWLRRLRSAGMTPDDETKLLDLREYLWRVGQRRSQSEANSSGQELNGILALKDLDIAPQMIFFDQDEDIFRFNIAQNMYGQQQKPRTIAQALQDASADPENERRSNVTSAVDDDRSMPRGSHQTVPSRVKQSIAPGAGAKDGSVEEHTSSERKTLDSSDNIIDPSERQERRNTVLSLVGRKDPRSKASAEISTTATNAFGQIDTAFAKSAGLADKGDDPPPPNQSTRQRIAHSYQGHDPNVLKLLGALYIESFPLDLVEFGPIITLGKRLPIQRASGSSGSNYWKPEGTLIAMLAEHTAAVNRIAVAPDHTFFISASDDGSVKIWNTSRLERNVSHRSRRSHRHAPSVRVTALTFIENTYCFVSTGSDGSVHIVKVDLGDGIHSSSTKLLREYHLKDGQHAVWVEHYKSEMQTTLIIATNKSRIIALDLRSMEPIFELQNPLHHGNTTCFCIDKRHHWLLVGTTHGVLDLWDLRFRLHLKAWAFSGGSQIHRIRLSPGRSSKRNRVTIAGGTNTGEITTWDLEKTSLRETWDAEKNPLKEVFRSGSFPSKDLEKLPRLIELDEDRPGSMVHRFVSQDTNEGPGVLSTFSAVDRGVRALVVGSHYTDDGREPRFHFCISAGPDWKVRFWDARSETASMVVSGLEPGASIPAYKVTEKTQELVIVTEMHGGTEETSDNRMSANPSKGASPASRKSAIRQQQQRSSLISAQQQQLLKNHIDNIEDVALVESPYGMIVSADRSGVIYVYA